VIGDTAESSDENNLMPLRPAYDLPVFNRHTIFLFAWHILRVQYRLPCIHPGRKPERAGTQDGFSHPIFYHALHTCMVCACIGIRKSRNKDILTVIITTMERLRKGYRSSFSNSKTESTSALLSRTIVQAESSGLCR